MKYHWTKFDKTIHRLMRLQRARFLDTGILTSYWNQRKLQSNISTLSRKTIATTQKNI